MHQKRHLSRRQVLSQGLRLGIGAGALIGPCRPLLGQTSAGAANLLFIYCSGGWDPSMVFDSKIGASQCVAEAGAVAATGGGGLPFVDHPNRPLTQQFFRKYGANAAIVNGLYCGSLEHRAAAMQTLGIIPPGQDRPVDWLTYYAANLNPSLPLPHVVIDAPFMPGTYADSAAHLTTATIQEYQADIPATDTLGAAGETALAAFRQGNFAAFTPLANTASLDHHKLNTLSAAVAHEPIMAAQITTAVKTLGDPGSDSQFVRNGKLAIELFAQKASQAVTLQAGAENLWDTTTGNYARQTQAFEMLFGGLANILAYAGKRGLDSNLQVVVVSEMGRSPLLNSSGGKDPWPYTSALAYGKGINGGIVVGKTDDALRGQPINPVFGTSGDSDAVIIEMPHVFGAVYLRAGIPQKPILPGLMPLSRILKG